MASSSSSHPQIQKFNAFYGIEPNCNKWKAFESSRSYDVFINHRGPDVKQTLATQLYNSLQQLGISAFLDSKEKETGISLTSTIKTAIRSAKVHIAIFSKRYAQSPWCLAELVQMLQSQTKIIPVFYEVEPWELRHIERGQYADAFIKYEEKGRYLEKFSEWKEALQFVSFIAGEEFHSFSDCENIVAAVKKEVHRKLYLHVAQYPVGLDKLVVDFERLCLNELVQDFENQCGLKERRHKPKVVGISGMGGSGKTTLAKDLFNRKLSDYSRASFLFDVREASLKSELPSLQSQLLKDLFNENPCFRSIEEGKSYLNDCQQRSPSLNFLIVVDDIDHVEQLNALLVMNILNMSGNSLVIVTTRDVGVVISAGITLVYPLKGMDRNQGRELFCWHAFSQPHPRTAYEALVDEFVDMCGGLPLSLQVLGRHVHGRAHNYWQAELTKARMTLPLDVKQRLRISFESLDDEQKHVFMDTACFFVGKWTSIAEKVWEGSGWNAQHALQTLKDKCLVEEEKKYYLPHFRNENVLRMHDHLRDLGREMAHELSPPHRLWRPQDLQSLESMGFKTILSKTNVRCFSSIFDESLGSKVTFFLGQSDSCIETLASLPWLQIEGNSTELPSIPSSVPSWIPLQKLQCLKIIGGRFKTLWENGMQVPSLLKELQISGSLNEFLEFSGIYNNLENALLDARGTPITGMSSGVRDPINGLEKLEISYGECLSKILISGMHLPSLQSIKLHKMEELVEVDLRMVKTLNCLEIKNCEKLRSVSGISDLAKLKKLKIYNCWMLEFDSLCLRGMKFLETITFDRSVMLKCFALDGCQNLETAFLSREKLVKLKIRGCPELNHEPEYRDLSCLKTIISDGGPSCLRLSGCQHLRSVSGNFEFTALHVIDCPKLEELLPSLPRKSPLERLVIESCEKLENIAGIEEFCRLRWMRLRYCSNAVIRNCINKLKSVPSVGMDMIGRAADGAESSLNKNMFRETNIGVDGVIEIGIDKTDPKCSGLSFLIGCFVVVVDSSAPVQDIYEPNFCAFDCARNLRQGEWIITSVACDKWRYFYHTRVEDVLRRKGIIKKGFRVVVKKGEEWKGVEVLRTIVDKLYY